MWVQQGLCCWLGFGKDIAGIYLQLVWKKVLNLLVSSYYIFISGESYYTIKVSLQLTVTASLSSKSRIIAAEEQKK